MIARSMTPNATTLNAMTLNALKDSAMTPATSVEAAKPTLNRGLSRSIAGLAVLQTALFAVPMIVLGGAIGWPASLRLPADQALPLIAAHADAVLLGYAAYLIVSIALIPLAFALRAWFAARGITGWFIDAATFIGAGAGLFKTLGIVRWLSVMPMLASDYVRATDPVLRQMLALSYTTINAYAGAVGELLGVQLLSGLWLLATGLLLRQTGKGWIGAFGMLCGMLFLLTALRVAWPMAGMLQSAAVPLALVWFLALSVSLWRDSRT